MTAVTALPSHSINEAPRSHPLIGSTTRPSDKLTAHTAPTSFEQRVDDALVALKGAVAQYAMHLSAEQRQVVFDQLENIINIEDWYEEDEFPKLNSFTDLLAWTIYAGVPQWHSLGVDDDGDVLIAWHTDDVTLTANFDGGRLVRWTSRYKDGDGTKAHAAGDCSLRQFARQAKFYLQGDATDGV